MIRCSSRLPAEQARAQVHPGRIVLGQREQGRVHSPELRCILGKIAADAGATQPLQDYGYDAPDHHQHRDQREDL